VDALLHRGYIYGQLERFDEATAAFTRPPAPTQEGTSRIFGLTYLQKKDYAKAVSQLEKAVALDPNNVQFNYQLGAALERARQLDGRRASFARCCRWTRTRRRL